MATATLNVVNASTTKSVVVNGVSLAPYGNAGCARTVTGTEAKIQEAWATHKAAGNALGMPDVTQFATLNAAPYTDSAFDSLTTGDMVDDPFALSGYFGAPNMPSNGDDILNVYNVGTEDKNAGRLVGINAAADLSLSSTQASWVNANALVSSASVRVAAGASAVHPSATCVGGSFVANRAWGGDNGGDFGRVAGVSISFQGGDDAAASTTDLVGLEFFPHVDVGDVDNYATIRLRANSGGMLGSYVNRHAIRSEEDEPSSFAGGIRCGDGVGTAVPTSTNKLEVDGDAKVNGVTNLGVYTVGTLPAVGTGGGMIYVSDAAGSAVTAFSNGTNWLRTDTSAIIS